MSNYEFIGSTGNYSTMTTDISNIISDESSSSINDHYMRHWSPYFKSQGNNFFTEETVSFISKRVTELTIGVDSMKRHIIVPRDSIIAVMNNIYDTYRPHTGDIYSRYNIPEISSRNDHVTDMINQTIEVITSNIVSDYGTELCNSKLTAWTTVLGDHNQHGLRSHAPIKISKRHGARCQFNMNY